MNRRSFPECVFWARDFGAIGLTNTDAGVDVHQYFNILQNQWKSGLAPAWIAAAMYYPQVSYIMDFVNFNRIYEPTGLPRVCFLGSGFRGNRAHKY